MTSETRQLDWILSVLIDLNSRCEAEGETGASGPLVSAIECIAPLARNRRDALVAGGGEPRSNVVPLFGGIRSSAGCGPRGGAGLPGKLSARDLCEALEADAIVPFFQPQVSAADGRLVGVEVLARWLHPQRGVIPASDFVSLASRLGMQRRIDRGLMRRTRQYLLLWQLQGLQVPRVSFNLGPAHVRDDELLTLARAIREEGTEVSFELLEDMLVEDQGDDFCAALDRIRAAGIGIEVDDFGSGHTSMIGLLRIVPDVLKLDRRLTALVDRDPKARQVTAKIVEIAQGLGIPITAEGVETEAQAAAMTEIGCTALQGFLVAPPMPAAALEDYIRRQGAAGQVTPRLGGRA